MFFGSFFYVFLVPRAARPKKYQKYHPRASPEPSGDPPGSLKSINFAPRGGPGVQPIICFGSPGRPQAPFGALLAATLGPHGAQKRPGSLQELIWCSPGTFWEHCWFHVHAFPTLVSHSSHVMLCFVFVCVLALARCVLKASKPSF